MGIRARIILSFLSLLIVPFMIVFLSLFIVNSSFFGGPLQESLESLSGQADIVLDTFSENYDLIHTDNGMDRALSPLLDQTFHRAIFADTQRTVLYDSTHLLEGKALSEFTGNDDSLETFDMDVYVDDVYTGTLVLEPEISLQRAFKLLVYLPVIMIVIFILTIIALIFILSKILADGILNPLRELNYAAERIAAGDLEFQMNYNRDDEFGKLCQEFDYMRLKLRSSLTKQAQYEKSRRQLIASISHDLKTPLTSIKGYVEGLQDGLVTDEVTYQRYLKVIWDKSNRLNHLIDDLFIFSKMELGEFKIESVQVDADMLLEEILSTRENELKDTPIQFAVKRPLQSGKLFVDPHRIGQVLDNLIDNALKFTRSKIEISTDIKEDFYLIYVRDDGIGMSEEDLPYIFDHFYKIDKVRSSSSKGTGLGLAICKELIESHGGSIHVRSKENAGTSFKIVLPML
jgi:signal transduction histidine kinase